MVLEAILDQNHYEWGGPNIFLTNGRFERERFASIGVANISFQYTILLLKQHECEFQFNITMKNWLEKLGWLLYVCNTNQYCYQLLLAR